VVRKKEKSFRRLAVDLQLANFCHGFEGLGERKRLHDYRKKYEGFAWRTLHCLFVGIFTNGVLPSNWQMKHRGLTTAYSCLSC
jgi:hypothetical protein